MKESILISDESYHENINQLWRAVKRFRNEAKYKDVTYKLTMWVLCCDGEIVKQRTPTDDDVDLTNLFAILPFAPSNGELLKEMAGSGVDVATELPAMITGMIEINYTTV